MGPSYANQILLMSKHAIYSPLAIPNLFKTKASLTISSRLRYESDPLPQSFSLNYGSINKP